MKKILFISLILIIALSSCYRGGFGCKGNSRSITGEGMHKRYSRLN